MTPKHHGRHTTEFAQGANPFYAILANLIAIGPTVFSEDEGTSNWSSEVS